jgi:hypothetical protein
LKGRVWLPRIADEVQWNRSHFAGGGAADDHRKVATHAEASRIGHVLDRDRRRLLVRTTWRLDRDDFVYRERQIARADEQQQQREAMHAEKNITVDED